MVFVKEIKQDYVNILCMLAFLYVLVCIILPLPYFGSNTTLNESWYALRRLPVFGDLKFLTCAAIMFWMWSPDVLRSVF